nr:transposase domain-containing protein [Streptomyces sp. SID5469]
MLLAAVLFEECGYLAVWRKLTAALDSILVVTISGTALWDARTRLGVRPVRALFDLLRGPASAVRTAGARWAGMLVVAIDGTHFGRAGPVVCADSAVGVFRERGHSMPPLGTDLVSALNPVSARR